jgi:hypothetical protein
MSTICQGLLHDDDVTGVPLVTGICPDGNWLNTTTGACHEIVGLPRECSRSRSRSRSRSPSNAYFRSIGFYGSLELDGGTASTDRRRIETSMGRPGASPWRDP